jgi:hypothetical protein
MLTGLNRLKMKNVILPLFLSLFCFLQCKKQNEPLNITLYNKPLATIQSYIRGKWKLEYVKGGFIANYIKYFNNDNYIWQFNSNNKIKQTYNDTAFADTTIMWVRDLGMYTGPDPIFIMKFYDKRGYPYNYVVDGIFNDSLQLHDNAYDPQYFHFSKLN